MSESKIIVREMGVRDGLQSLKEIVDTADKVKLIDQLSLTGVPVIQATSFAHPRWVPQMADAEAVLAGIQRRPGVRYTATVMNARGLERAMATTLDAVSFPVGATDGFNRKNANKSTADLMEEVKDLVQTAHTHGFAANITVSVAFGCPYEGSVSPATTLDLTEKLLGLGPDEITLGDTIGVANPAQVREVMSRVVNWAGRDRVGVHFHDTRGLGIANCLAALEAGCGIYDGSVGGIGGCPFAPGATGNIATEEFVLMAEEMGLATGIDLAALLESARMAEKILGFTLPGRLMRAGLFAPLA